MTVMIRRWSPGEDDSHGVPSDRWGAPELFPVRGYGPTGSTDDARVGGARVTDGITLYGPVGCSHRDRFVVGGDKYEVSGSPQDWGSGPYGHHPGWVIDLVAVRG